MSTSQPLLKKPIVFVIILLMTFCTAALVFLNDILNRFRPMVADSFQTVLHRSVSVNGDLEISWGLPPTIVANDVRIANAGWAATPQMAVIRNIEATPDWLALLRGRPAFDRIVIRGATFVVERNRKGQWSIPKTVLHENHDEITNGTSLPTVTMKNSSIVLRTPAKDYRIVLNRFAVSFGGQNASTRADLDILYEDIPLTVAATFAPTAALFQNQAKITMDLVLRYKTNMLRANGTVSSLDMPPRLDVRVALTADDLGSVAELRKLHLGLDKPIKLTGRLHNLEEGGYYRLSDFLFTSGSDNASGWIELASLAQPISLKAELRSTHFDARPYWPPSGMVRRSAETAPGGGPKRIFSTDPLDWNLLKKIDADARLNVQGLKLPRLVLEDLDGELSIKNGRLDLNLVRASAGGGTFQGKMQLVSAKQFEIDVRTRVRDLDLGKMLKTFGLSESIRGKTNFYLAVNGKGLSPAQIAGSLDGHISLAMQGGQLASRYVRQVERYDINLTDSLLKLFKLDQRKETDYVDIDCVACNFDIKHGIAHTNILVFDTDRTGIVGNGQILLKDESLDMTLKLVNDAGIGIPGLARLNIGTGPIADSFRVGGTLSNPQIHLDKGETVLTLGKAIGGLLLFGPAGLTGAFLESEFGESTPCVKALKAAGAIQEGDH